MKIKWRHNKNIGKVKFKNPVIIEMLKLGAKFELTPAYRIYYDKDGKEIKREIKHISLRVIKE